MEKETFQIESGSPWAILAAHLAARGEKHKIDDIKEYLALKEEHDKVRSTGRAEERNTLSKKKQERFNELKNEISNLYFIKTDFENYIDGDKSESKEAKDFAKRVENLTRYISAINSSPEKAINTALNRSISANKRRRSDAAELARQIKGGREFWQVPQDAPEHIPSLFMDIVQESLTKYSSKLSSAINLANSATNGQNKDWKEAYKKSIEQVGKFLENPNEREDLSLIDLTYVIGEHRGATSFRDSTTGYYAGIDAMINGLNLSMPAQEKFRQEVDLTHNCVDPNYQNLSYTTKLSFVNAKHKLGLSSKDIDFYGAALGSVSSIMRGYGIDEIDDRFKQYLHNTADHSLRACVTIASVRDASIRRLKKIYDEKLANAANADKPQIENEFQQVINKTQESSAYFVRKACLHDMGEFLDEVLGNNLVGKSEEEEKALRSLRDQLEERIQSHYAKLEIEHRLTKDTLGWKNGEVKVFMDSENERDKNYDNKFYHTTFEIFERLNSNHDIVTLRSVGRINQEGKWQNVKNVSFDQSRYTLQYVWSKITGHKFKDTDPVNIAEYQDSEYKRRIEKSAYNASNQIAAASGAAAQYNPKITRKKDHPNTDLPLDDYMMQKDIDYPKSIFKNFVDSTISDYKNLTKEEARAKQISNEEMLYGVCYEMIHYTKKQGRIEPHLDSSKIEIAVRKVVSQGIDAAQADLKRNGLELVSLQPAEIIKAEKRYPLGVKKRSMVFSDREKPEQITSLIHPDGVRAVASIFDGTYKLANDCVVKPIATIPVAMALAHNQSITEQEFKQLFESVAVLEAGGDASLALAGFMQTGSLMSADAKEAALLNPLISASLAKPQRNAEAIEKCYKYILSEFHEEIASKYGLDEKAIDSILTRENMESGKYSKKSSDITLSGTISENMYDYFVHKYKNNNDNSVYNKDFEAAERYILRKIFRKEKIKLENRLDQEINQAQISSYEEKIADLIKAREIIAPTGGKETDKKRGIIGTAATIGAAIGAAALAPHLDPSIIGDAINITSAFPQMLYQDPDSIKGQIASYSDDVHDFRAEYALPIRFAATSALGGVMMGSGVGGDIPIPLTDSHIDSNIVYGGNLMLAGAAAFLASINKNIKELAISDPVRNFVDSYPRAELKNGHIYIVKGVTRKKADLPDNVEQDLEISSKLSQTNAKAFEQIKDGTLALFGAPIRALAAQGANMFTNQTTVSGWDSAATVAKNLGTGDGLVQSAASISATVLFARVGVLNMYMSEIQKAIHEGNSPDFVSIKKKISEELKSRGSAVLLNGIKNFTETNAGRTFKDAIHSALEPTGYASKLLPKVDDGSSWRINISKDDSAKEIKR